MSADPLSPVPPGGTVGILGGGQLGRMLGLAAARLGLKTHIYAPAGDTPAVDIAAHYVRGSSDYHQNLAAFARDCDVVTLEFENVPVAALDVVSHVTPMRPGRKALETAQDRLVEKRFLRSLGASTAEVRPVDGIEDLKAALIEMGGEGILKTRRMGYDGHGQARISASGPGEVDAAARRAFGAIGKAPAILEARAGFVREIAVIVARGVDGAVACYDPTQTLHENGILRRSLTPGAVTPDAAARARDVATMIVEGLDYVGVMGVELFEMPDGRLLVNEIAPRVHNSGHWTLEACVVSQFEQHVRAVCGWPLGSTERHSDAETTNLLGFEADEWPALAAEPGAALHLYGKASARAGRKMGHVTRLSPRAAPGGEDDA
jgi:5-(carboxyamino)imidazole ribonucleotide synthase